MDHFDEIKEIFWKTLSKIFKNFAKLLRSLKKFMIFRKNFEIWELSENLGGFLKNEVDIVWMFPWNSRQTLAVIWKSFEVILKWGSYCRKIWENSWKSWCKVLKLPVDSCNVKKKNFNISEEFRKILYITLKKFGWPIEKFGDFLKIIMKFKLNLCSSFGVILK